MRTVAPWPRRRAWLAGLVGALVLALAVPLWPTVARAQATLDVLQVGWDGRVVPETWSPMRVRASGGGADLSARIEVVLLSRYQTGPQATPIELPVGAYAQEVALPAGVEKEVVVWVPVEGNPIGLVRLMAGDEMLAEERVEFRSAQAAFWPLVGVLAEAPSIARSVAQVELPFQGLPVPLDVARLGVPDLPPSAERLSALSALIVQGDAPASMTGEQRRAVEEWVSAGGHVVLVGGPEASRAAAVLPAGTLAITFTGTGGAAELGPLAHWAGRSEQALGEGPITSFEASAGTLLAGTLERPLAWRLGSGQGTITLLAADPSLQPLAGWSGAPALWHKLLEPALPSGADIEAVQYRRMAARQSELQLVGTVDALPPEAVPGWRAVGLILGGFALLVGPALHLVLRRTDRRGWVWIAVPAMASLGSASLFVVGVGREGRDVLANVVTHVRLDPATGQARQYLAAGFYAPSRSELTVTVPDGAGVRATSYGDSPYSYPPAAVPGAVAQEPPFRVVAGREARVEFGAGQWGMRTLTMARTLGEVGAISAKLGLEGSLIKGTIRNETPYPLEDAAVVVGQSLVKLGGLAPGQAAPVVLDAGAETSGHIGGFPLSYRLLGRPVGEVGSGSASGPVSVRVASGVSARAVAVPAPARVVSNPATFQPLELPRDPEVQRRARLLDAVSNVMHSGPAARVTPLTFLAFTRAPIGEASPRAGQHPVYHLTLVEQLLTLDLSPGPFTMPGVLSPPEVLEQTTRGMGGGSNGVVSWVEIHAGAVVYGFRPPLPAGAQVEALVLQTQQVGQATSLAGGKGVPPPAPDLMASPAEAGVFSVYNWQSSTWEALPAGQTEARLAPATPYVGPEGLVKLQVSAGEDQVVRVVMPTLAVEGRVLQ